MIICKRCFPIAVSILFYITTTNFVCKKETLNSCFKGKLVKGLCNHYTIQLLEGQIDPILIEKTWTDTVTNVQHSNVFKLVNYCDFPITIVEGDEFYFEIDNNLATNCTTCGAIYPTPEKKLAIRVINSACN